MDNAIEASLDSITKEVTIALISSDTKVVIVENTIAQESINTVGIFKLGRSSKGEGRGIGLSTVREILGSILIVLCQHNLKTIVLNRH